MSVSCSYCGIVSRNACSDYEGRYLAEELRRCPNLHEGERYYALVRAGANTKQDDEQFN